MTPQFPVTFEAIYYSIHGESSCQEDHWSGTRELCTAACRINMTHAGHARGVCHFAPDSCKIRDDAYINRRRCESRASHGLLYILVQRFSIGASRGHRP